MTVMNWIGVGFFGVVLIFFMFAYFRPPKTPGEFAVLRILASVFAGLAGAFLLSGEITFKLTGLASEFGNIAVDAGGAMALFAVVWFTFPKPPARDTSAAGHISATFPDATNFRQAAEILAQVRQKSVGLKGFTQEEEKTGLRFFNLKEQSEVAAFQRLADLVPPNKVRPYKVHQSDSGSHFDLIVAVSAGAQNGG